MTYDSLKCNLSQSVYLENSKHLQHISSAIVAGALGDFITNPFWVVRTRIQTHILHSSEQYGPKLSTLNMFRHIYTSEGIRAFYKGLGASFLGLSHVAIQFPLYEYLKAESILYRKAETATVFDITATSAAAKFVASMITYPHEVLRSRLQDGRKKSRGLFKELVAIVKEEGTLSLWSGYRMNLLRIFPATISTFVAYELISNYIKNGAIRPGNL